MKMDLQRVSFIEDARRILNGARLSVSRLYSITGVDWLIAAGINFSSTTALRFADLEGLPSNNTMGPVNARPLQDVRLNHDEGNREERPGRFLTTRAPIGQHVKMFRQVATPPSHVKERTYPKQVSQDGDVQRYGGLKAIKKDETTFAAYDKAEIRKAKIMIVANSEFVYTSKSLFWPDVIMLAAVDLDLLQAVSLAIGVQRQTVMNPITTAPYGTIDDAGRVRLSRSVMTREGFSDTMPPMGSSKVPERRIRKMPAKKVSRVIDVQKNNQLRYNFTGVPETDPRACFNRATWNPAVNLQQPPLGTSHLILGDSLVRVLSNLRTSWVTRVMAFGGATIAQLYRMVELMNPGRIPNVMILVGTNNISRSSDEEEALWESMMVCLFTTLWQKFNCAVLTVCAVPMNTRSLTATGRRHNEGVVKWNNILRNLASRNAGRMIL